MDMELQRARGKLVGFYSQRDATKLDGIERILQMYTPKQIDEIVYKQLAQERTVARQQLQQFYQARDPSKLPHIDGIMAQYAGREHEVVKMLDNARRKETAVARQALHSFYERQDPAKLSQIDNIMGQYAGREYEVLRMLEQAAQAEHQPEQNVDGNRGLVRRFSERTTRRLSTEGKALALAGDRSPAEEEEDQASTAAAAGSGKDSTRELARKFSENTSRRLSIEGRSLVLGQSGADLSPDDLDLHIELSDDEDGNLEPPPVPVLQKVGSQQSVSSSTGSAGSGGATIGRRTGGRSSPAERCTSGSSGGGSGGGGGEVGRLFGVGRSGGRDVGDSGAGKLFGGTFSRSFSHEKLVGLGVKARAGQRQITQRADRISGSGDNSSGSSSGAGLWDSSGQQQQQQQQQLPPPSPHQEDEDEAYAEQVHPVLKYGCYGGAVASETDML